MHARFLRPFLLIILLPTAAGPARGEVLELSEPDRDNTIFQDKAGGISNGAGSYAFFGRIGTNPGPKLRRMLMRFDLSSIPPDAIVDSVEIEVVIERTPATGGGTATMHRLTADWGEGSSNAPGEIEGQGTAAAVGDATWLHSFHDTVFWTTPGGEFVADASASVGYGASPQTVVFTSTADLVSDVTQWVRNPSQNFGWILIGNEDNDLSARRVGSREGSGVDPVSLRVEFHVPSPTDGLTLGMLTNQVVRPVAITNAGDGSDRLFIVEQAGRIRVFDLTTDTLLETPFLDITDLVDDAGNEQGLLGLAFHPDYASNGRFYVNYTYDPPGVGDDRTRVAMYQVSKSDPDVAGETETPILEFDQDSSSHNGGDMHFDRDGYLVISSGDGGGSGDIYDNAQNVDTLKGAMLRIDVDGSGGSTESCGLVQAYSIPPGNAFSGTDDGCDEILHYGLRNPWRFSFDALTDDMYIGDVGQGDWEEVDFASPGVSGLNFGWSCFEGTHVYDAGETCPNPVAPIIEYSSGTGSGNAAVTGGYVYRGVISSLYGYYVYADYASARVWFARDTGSGWTSEEWDHQTLDSISAFGQDEDCNLYVADFGSLFSDGDESVYRIMNSGYIARLGFETLRCR